MPACARSVRACQPGQPSRLKRTTLPAQAAGGAHGCTSGAAGGVPPTSGPIPPLVHGQSTPVSHTHVIFTRATESPTDACTYPGVCDTCGNDVPLSMLLPGGSGVVIRNRSSLPEQLCADQGSSVPQPCSSCSATRPDPRHPNLPRTPPARSCPDVFTLQSWQIHSPCDDPFAD